MVHEQAAGFALDALDADETAEFERHLAACPACEDEVARLRVAAVALAFAITPLLGAWVFAEPIGPRLVAGIVVIAIGLFLVVG